MRKLIGYIPVRLISLIIIVSILILGSCKDSNGNGFAIYLTKGDIPPAQMPVLSHVDVVELPIISMEDIRTYNAQTHELKLTTAAFERIYYLDVPVSGRSFVVCVDGKPIYWGAFWTLVSSISFDGVTVWKPYGTGEPHIVNLELGYPGSAFYGGKDPRNNPEVIRSLEQAGKLITRLTLEAVIELPRSMKGYELYSWLEEDEWQFTLITGTDRNKNLEEIISTEDYISEAGWMQIHVTGIDAIKVVLGKLHQGEEIFWLSAPRLEQTTPDNIRFMLPQGPNVDLIEEHATQHGLDLQVVQPLP